MKNNKRYLIYILLFVFLSIYSLDRVTMAIAGSSVAKEMGLSPVALGYLFSSYLWLYAVVLLPAGAATDRFGAQRTGAIAATMWSICQALGGAAVSYFTLLLTRLGLGLFRSAANPCAHRAIREWTPRRGAASPPPSGMLEPMPGQHSARRSSPGSSPRMGGARPSW